MIVALLCLSWSTDRSTLLLDLEPPASDLTISMESSEGFKAISRPLLQPVIITQQRRQVDSLRPVEEPGINLPVPVRIESIEASHWKNWSLALLDELGVPAHEHAVAFLIGWQKSEGCKHHNPFCRLDEDRRPYRYASERSGARAMAAQLDQHHAARPAEWRSSYPAIVEALYEASSYTSARALAESVADDLHRWCGPAVICGHDSYPAAVARRTAEAAGE